MFQGKLERGIFFQGASSGMYVYACLDAWSSAQEAMDVVDVQLKDFVNHKLPHMRDYDLIVWELSANQINALSNMSVNLCL